MVSRHGSFTWQNIKSQVYIGLHDTFLPAGYPNSVADGYLKFCLFNNLSALSITAMYFLSA